MRSLLEFLSDFEIAYLSFTLFVILGFDILTRRPIYTIHLIIRFLHFFSSSPFSHPISLYPQLAASQRIESRLSFELTKQPYHRCTCLVVGTYNYLWVLDGLVLDTRILPFAICVTIRYVTIRYDTIRYP